MGERNGEGLSDDDLMAHLTAVCREDARTGAEIVTYLIEVEARSMYLRKACTSMFDFCTRLLKMSTNVASARIAVARIAKRHRCLLPAIARGDLHLSTAILLRHHMTSENAEGLLKEIRGMSYRKVESFLAARSPKPDIPERIASVADQLALTPSGLSTRTTALAAARVTPLSATRFAVQLTVSEAVRDKLERAKDLMRHRNPDGNLEVILDRALDALIVNLERQLRGKTKRRGQGRPTSVKPGVVSSEARREVFERDGEQCTYEDKNGNRCPARGFLEIDHIAARALGGEGSPPNLRVRCKPHNRLHAEEVFGREHVERAIERRRAKSASASASAEQARPEAVEMACSAAEVLAPAESLAPAKSLAVADSPAVGGGIEPVHDIDRSECSAERGRALRGLVGLGFKRREAERALDVVLDRHGGALIPGALPALLRDAIRVLT